MKRCYVCQKEKPLEDFYSNKASKNGRTAECKECEKARMKRRKKDPRVRNRNRKNWAQYTINSLKLTDADY